MSTAASWLWREDTWQRCEGLPATDRGFRHGMSVFETIALRQGRFLFLREHLAKLRESALLTGLRPPPPEFEPSFSALELPVSSGIARLYVTAGDGDFLAPLDHGRLVLLVEDNPLPVDAPLKILQHPEPFTSTWPGLKTGNYWNHIRAWRDARQAGFDEAILVNPTGHVLSACLSNVFAVIDGILMTPRPASGARRGVLRDWVTDHHDVILSDFHPEQLQEASEIFLTNSVRGIRSVAQFDHFILPQPTIAPGLQSQYLREIVG